MVVDDIDRANALAETRRKATISNIVNRPKLAQQYVDGEVVCLDCHEEIDKARLDANPLAAMCVPCAEKREKKGKQYGR